MKTAWLSTLFALSTLSITASSLAGCSLDTGEEVDDESEVAESAVTGSQANFGYFVVTRKDDRKCAAPHCGGYFVKSVNEATSADWYVSEITFPTLNLSTQEEDQIVKALVQGRALIKAKIFASKPKKDRTWVKTLKANEAWLGATGSKAEGTFYRAADNGLRCIKAPCPTTTAYTLNSRDEHNVIDAVLDQTDIKASDEILWRAQQAVGTKNGILVAGGIILPKCKPNAPDCGPKVVAQEFFLPFVHTEGTSCGGFRAQPTFCNEGQICLWKEGDICGAADAPGTCQYRPEMCPQMYDPVCSCDGKTYGNACMAAAAGASVSTKGACAEEAAK